jgi:hypothetical protein
MELIFQISLSLSLSLLRKSTYILIVTKTIDNQEKKELNNIYSPSSSSVAPGRATKNGSEGTAPSSYQFFAFFSSKSIYNMTKINVKTLKEIVPYNHLQEIEKHFLITIW